jgi:hypothetical protein
MSDSNDNSLAIFCPHCNDKLKIDLALSGQVVDCPHCAKQLTVPGATATHQQAPAPPQYQQAPAPPQYQQAPAPPQYQQAPAPPQYQQAPAPPQYQQAPQDFHQQNPYFPPPSSSPTGGISTALTNPLEGQPQAIAEMGPGATLRWGWILGGIWIIATWLMLWQIWPISTLLFDLPGSIDFLGASLTTGLKPSDHIKMIASAAIPFFCLMLVLLLLKALGNRRGHFGSIVFTSGMAMLPFCVISLWLVVASMIEINTAGGAKVMGHITFLLLAFFLTGWILLIRTSLVSVLGFAPKAALWIVPLVVVGWAYLSMWIVSLLAEITN